MALVIFMAPACIIQSVRELNPAVSTETTLETETTPNPEAQRKFALLAEVYRAIDRYHVETNSASYIATAAIAGLADIAELPDATQLITDFSECQSGLEPNTDDETVFVCVFEAYIGTSEDFRQQIGYDQSFLTAVNGMTAALDDRYASYVSPSALEIRETQLSGQFEGIGAYVIEDPNSEYFIIAPIKDSPSQRAGIMAGDKVIAVNNKSVTGMLLEDFIGIVRGPKGTTVVLGIEREDRAEPIDIKIVRDVIHIPSVETSDITDSVGPNVGYIRVNAFTSTVPRELEAALKSLVAEGKKGIVLDLRFNTGGLLSETVAATGLLIGDNKLVLYAIDKTKAREEFFSNSHNRYANTPLVVLVNAISASGAEVMAAALQSHERAVIVGTKTFGKGSVTRLVPLSNDGAINLTSARWYTPDDELIEELGVTPDKLVEQELDVELLSPADLQFTKAVEELQLLTR